MIHRSKGSVYRSLLSGKASVASMTDRSKFGGHEFHCLTGFCTHCGMSNEEWSRDQTRACLPPSLFCRHCGQCFTIALAAHEQYCELRPQVKADDSYGYF